MYVKKPNQKKPQNETLISVMKYHTHWVLFGVFI